MGHPSSNLTQPREELSSSWRRLSLTRMPFSLTRITSRKCHKAAAGTPQIRSPGNPSRLFPPARIGFPRWKRYRGARGREQSRQPREGIRPFRETISRPSRKTTSVSVNDFSGDPGRPFAPFQEAIRPFRNGLGASGKAHRGLPGRDFSAFPGSVSPRSGKCSCGHSVKPSRLSRKASRLPESALLLAWNWGGGGFFSHLVQKSQKGDPLAGSLQLRAR